MNPDWARHLVTDCETLSIPVFLKQWGTYKSNPGAFEHGRPLAIVERMDPQGNGKGGALLDGRLLRMFPEVQF